jgi:curved DNA-binding protein CbpA
MLKNIDNSKSEERRNYYRTLNVQPDASLEIIKNNYRTLLQKLKMHPDLGGQNWNASIINEAYNTLRDPLKRAAYDKELLELYDLKALARGNLDNNSTQQQEGLLDGKDKHGNQRNFYRMFNIQADSPQHIIKTSYLTLSKDPYTPKDLLNEAYTILSNPRKRALYDKLLNQRSHTYAVSKLTNQNTATESRIKSKTVPVEKAQTSIKNISALNAKYGAQNNNYYNPVITQYCNFCKTPHNQSPCRDTAPLCNECKSPLFPPPNDLLEQTRRNIVRINHDSEIHFYTHWPQNKKIGAISDISPTGIQLNTTIDLPIDQIVKLDGKDFKAVGIVSYQNKNQGLGEPYFYTSGIKFLTVNFNKSKGQFFSDSA